MDHVEGAQTTQERIRAALDAIGWSINQWAADAGVRQRTASDWANEYAPVPAAELERIERIAEAHRANPARKLG